MNAPPANERSENEFLSETDPGAIALGIVLDGLKDPLAGLVSDGTTGLLVDLVFGPQTPDYTEELDRIQTKLDRLEKLSSDANARMTKLESQLRITKDELAELGLTSTLAAPTTHIESLFSGNASGGVDDCDPTTALSSSLCWYTSKDRTAETKRLAASDFTKAVEPAVVLAELAQVNRAICPPDAQSTALLDNYADLVGGRLEPTNAGVARSLDAIESRFVSLVRTQIHGLRVLAAYYQFEAKLDPTRAEIAADNLASLSSYAKEFSRQADAYLAATARYAAVVGGNPAFLVKDAATGAMRVDPALVGRLGRAPAVADAVRSLGAHLGPGANAGAVADVVHAVFLARQTDDAFGRLTVTATASDDRSRTATVDITATRASAAAAYAYAGAGAGRELHTQKGQYGAFVRANAGAPLKLAIEDGWWVYEVSLPLPAGTRAAASAADAGPSRSMSSVDLVVTTHGRVGTAPFSRALSAAPAVTSESGTVYIAAADFRMDGPTSRVDLLPWTIGPGTVDTPCECGNFDFNHYGDPGDCSGGPTLASHASAADGALAELTLTTGRSIAPGCNVQEALSVASTFAADATNAVFFGATRQVRTGDTAKWIERGLIFSQYKDVDLTCDNDLEWFRDYYYAPRGSNSITVGSIAVSQRTGEALFTSDMTTTCDPDFSQSMWLKSEGTLESVTDNALASRQGVVWDSGIQFVVSDPQTFAKDADSTLVVSAGFGLPPALSKVKVSTQLLSFGIYVP